MLEISSCPERERLHQIAVGAELKAALGDRRIVDAGEEHHRRHRPALGDLLDQDQAGLPRHLDVADREVDRRAFELPPRLGNAPRQHALEALAEGPLDHPEDLRAVVGGEDAERFGARLEGQQHLAIQRHQPSLSARSPSSSPIAPSSAVELKGFSMKPDSPESVSACGASTSWL